MVSFFLYVQLLVAAAAARAVLVVVVVASSTFEANTTAQNMPRTFRFLCQTHKTKASTTRRWRLVKFSLVWFFFSASFCFFFLCFCFYNSLAAVLLFLSPWQRPRLADSVAEKPLWSVESIRVKSNRVASRRRRRRVLRLFVALLVAQL